MSDLERLQYKNEETTANAHHVHKRFTATLVNYIIAVQY